MHKLLQLLQLLRTSIVYRSSALVLSIALCVGGMFAAFTYLWESNTEQELTKNRMGTLLSTVENTVSIACYLSDTNLAKEVAQGLLNNEDVASVKIYSNKQTLVDLFKNASPQSSNRLLNKLKENLIIQREVYSPFNPAEAVCQIEIKPNISFIREQINTKARFIALLLILQTLIMAGAVVIIVMYLITRPIKTISDRLHHLSADAKTTLPLPPGNEADEIGQLVRDVNTLFSKLSHLLEDERDLRVQHQIGEKKFRAIFENSETGIFLLNPSGEVLSSNPAYRRLFSMSNDASAESIKFSLIQNLNDYALRLQGMLENATHDEQVSSEDFLLEVGNPPQKKWINLVLSSVENKVLQGLVNDITERKMLEESANQLAMTDHLTNVANRLGLEKNIAKIQFEMHAGLISSFYVLMIDLDGFKAVNDRYGHEIGDKVLLHFTQLLSKIIRKSDFIARTGGDEFVVILKEVDAIDKVQHIATKIIHEASQAIEFGESIQIQIGASIGINLVDQGNFDMAKVLQRADEAMYYAKKSGKNRYHVFS
ncbi:sensor domain-containing diguanylate cyclase [Undibacterium baiyunense]|uniref:Diguanylate cyclase n=1 Tax=Undibacterium baiyunense TaxID=2828731 RepID=A0A941I3H6_9BURK|nr:sensor domain-containing diguanylate cyclase [Undibacterium baiyunense]MBR7746930.1 diguanylate cyclase [Undibacterium baiyunense]